MAHRQGSDHRTGWDHVPPETTGSNLAARRHAREADAAKRARRWCHARWIALNVALIASTAWLFSAVLIPRFIVGETAATRVAPDTWVADTPQQLSAGGRDADSANHGSPAESLSQPRVDLSQQRDRLRREPMITPAQQSAVDAFNRAMREGRGSCIDSRAFERIERNGVTHIQEIGRGLSLTCHLQATPGRD